MPIPDVTLFINGNASETYDHEVTLSITDVGVDPPQEMRFSNNTVDWSPWEIFAGGTKQWWLTTDAYGGSPTFGQRFVFAQFKNASGVFDVNDSITVARVAPKIFFSTDPVQRSDEHLVDIPYLGVEVHIIGAKINLIEAEFDLTGLFAGSEQAMSVKESDPSHTGITGLLFTGGGFEHNLVWDILEDVPAEEVHATTKIRLKAQYGEYESEFFVSEFFTIDTRAVAAQTLEGVTAKPGDTIKLELNVFDQNGDPITPDTPPEITSISDPDGAEYVTGPNIVMGGGAPVGYYFHDFITLNTYPEGQWVAQVEVTINGEVNTHSIPFSLRNDPKIFSPVGSNTCAVFGTLFCMSENRTAGMRVEIHHDDISDPGHFNPTSVDTGPIVVETDADGFFVVNLIRNLEVIIYIPQLQYRRRVKVPDLVAANFQELSINLPTPPRDQFGNRV